MASSPLQVYAVFHLNLAYSSIAEEQRGQVLQRCYWPLLRLVRDLHIPIGIEATGYTLQCAAELDPAWLEELRALISQGGCELIGSGYAQIIGPLVPAQVNAANLRLGNLVYERLIGVKPRVALVNEQAYSAGMVAHYLQAGYQAIMMEWDNPARTHPRWRPEWRYLPQRATGTAGEQIALIWNYSIAFQKFQRYAHGELSLDEYVEYLGSHVGPGARTLPLYGNDVEIFDFRPGRYHTEAKLTEEGEWTRIAALFRRLQADPRFQLVGPSALLLHLGAAGAGNLLALQSSDQPIPVKKQGKYNVTRWAVTGRDDLGINTECWRVYRSLRDAPATKDDVWRELCYLWSSDFRTHITARRWQKFRRRLALMRCRWDREDSTGWPDVAESPSPEATSTAGLITLTAGEGAVTLDPRRGLAIDGLWFLGLTSPPWCGTLRHGYYDDIHWGADFYSGHLVLEVPGKPKITDLSRALEIRRYKVSQGGEGVQATVATPLGPIRKTIELSGEPPCLRLRYDLGWTRLPIGSLRLGHVTLHSKAFDAGTLAYQTHNGGALETYPLSGPVDHGKAVSLLVSASHAIGMTEGIVMLGDSRRRLHVEVDKCTAAVTGMLSFQPVSGDYFCRLCFSAAEVDETRTDARSKGTLSLALSLRPEPVG